MLREVEKQMQTRQKQKQKQTNKKTQTDTTMKVKENRKELKTKQLDYNRLASLSRSSTSARRILRACTRAVTSGILVPLWLLRAS
jgi:multidrug resistance efflux pump